MKKRKQKPGEKEPASMQYVIVGPKGGKTGSERTITKGEHFPPTPESGQRYVIIDRSNNKAGKGL